MAAPTVRWRFVGVDLLIDPSAQRPGRGGGMRACRPTVRYTQKNRLAFASRFSVLALPIFLCRQSIVPPTAGPDVLCRICMRKATCRWQVAFQVLALPIFPCSHPQSIVGEGELNFCVRDGNRWTLTPINTNFVDAKSALLRFRRSLTRPSKTSPASLHLLSKSQTLRWFVILSSRMYPEN